jgi:hypothetical protein
MIDILLLWPSLHFTLLHYTCRQFTSSHLNLFNKTPPNAKVHVTSCAGSFAKDETDTACRDGMEFFPVVYLTRNIPRLSKCEASLSVSSVGYKTLQEPKPCNAKLVEVEHDMPVRIVSWRVNDCGNLRRNKIRVEPPLTPIPNPLPSPL